MLRNHLIQELTLLKWRSKKYQGVVLLLVKHAVCGYVRQASTKSELNLKEISTYLMNNSKPCVTLTALERPPNVKKSLSD